MTLSLHDTVIINKPNSVWYTHKGTIVMITSTSNNKAVYTVVLADGMIRDFQYNELCLPGDDDPLETQEFYELMQSYRHCPRENQAATVQYFKQVQDFIRKHKANL